MPDLSQFLSFAIPRSQNPYAIQGIAPSLLASMMESSTRSDLLAAAAKRVPDAATFTKAIMDRKLYPGVEANFTSAIKSRVGDFLEKYNKDPYYAFSQEGRNTIKELQNIVTSPALTQAEANKIDMDKAIDKLDENELLNNPVVSGNRVAVYRNGRRKMVPMSQLKKDDIILTPKTDYQLAQSGKLGTVPAYDMSAYNDVLDKVQKAATNMGTDSWKNVAGEFKTQDLTGRKRLEWLKSQGLSQSDLNTLTSEYVRRHGISDTPEEDASKWIFGQISDYIESAKSSLNKQNVAGVAGTAGAAGATEAALTKRNQKMSRLEASWRGQLGNQKPNYSSIPKELQKDEKLGKLTIDKMLPQDMWSMQDWGDYGSTTLKRGQLPININPVRGLFAPGATLQTPDGVPVTAATTVPDPDGGSFITWENGKPFLYMSVLHAEDAWWGNQAADNSKFVGNWSPQSLSYEDSPVGDMGWSDDPAVKYYDNIMGTVGEESGISPIDSGWIDRNEVYKGMVKVQLADEYESQARGIAGDKFVSSTYEALTPAQQSAADQQLDAQRAAVQASMNTTRPSMSLSGTTGGMTGPATGNVYPGLEQ